MLELLWFRVASFNLLLSVDWDQGIDRILAPRAAWLHGFRILLCLGVCFLVGLSDCLRSLGIDRLVSVPLALRSRLRRRLRWVTWLACLYIISYCIVPRFSATALTGGARRSEGSQKKCGRGSPPGGLSLVEYYMDPPLRDL